MLKFNILQQEKIMNLDFIGQVAFFKKKTGNDVRKLCKFKNKSSIEYNASLSIKQILEPLVEKEMRDINGMTEKFMRRLMANRMGLFTIVKFDFKDFFPSISLRYAYEFFIKDKINEKYHPLFENYVESVKYNLQGLPPSSNFAAVMAKAMKEEIFAFFKIDGLTDCFYYDDAFVMLFKKRVNHIYIKFGIEECVKNVFNKKNSFKYQNKVKVNNDNEKYVYLNDEKLPCSFSWLGYKFGITYGWQGIGMTIDFADEMIEHLRQKIFEAVRLNYPDTEKLRLMLYSSTRNVVTKIEKQGQDNRNVSITPFKFYKNLVKYKELIGENTVRFLQGVVIDAFRQQTIALPYYLYDQKIESGYNIWHNLFSHRAIVLNKKFGWSYPKLYNILKKHTNLDLHNKPYSELAKIYIDNFVIKY